MMKITIYNNRIWYTFDRTKEDQNRACELLDRLNPLNVIMIESYEDEMEEVEKA